MDNKFIVIAGTPVNGYRGTLTHDSLRCLGVFESLKEARNSVLENFGNACGLIEIFDVSTGKRVSK